MTSTHRSRARLRASLLASSAIGVLLIAAAPSGTAAATDHAKTQVECGPEPSGLTDQLGDYYDVQFRLNGGTWQTLLTKSPCLSVDHFDPSFRGNYVEYQYRAFIDASGPREAGGGWSNWSGPSEKVWHRPVAPTCTATPTWNSARIHAESVPMGPGAAADYQVRISGQSERGSGSVFGGLSPLTNYTAQARAANQAGWSEWGPSCSFQTLAPPIPGTVAVGRGATYGIAQPGGDITYLSIAGIQLSFGESTAAASYEVQYRYQFLASGWWSEWTPSASPTAAAGVTSVVASCVSASGEGVGNPQVRVRGTNLSGAGPWRTYTARQVSSPGCY